MIYNLTLKDQVENLTSGHGYDLTGKGHVAYQSIRIGRPEHIYGVFIAQVGFYQKLFPKKCW